jgi:hypothetical protein
VVVWPEAKDATTRSRSATVRRPVHNTAAPIRSANRRNVGRVNPGAMAWMMG